MIRTLLRSFSAGELTPELFGRIDFAKYQEGLATCRNFITLPHGPAINRTGTQFVREVKTSANATRVIPFSYNSQQVFAIELGAGYFRFCTNAQTLQAVAQAWASQTAYLPNDMVTAGGTAYFCVAPNTGLSPVQAAWSSASAYAVGNLVNYWGVTYICVNAHAATATTPPTANWSALWRWTTYLGAYAYAVGDMATSGGVTYYCTVANSGNPPPNAVYWYAMAAGNLYEIPNPYAAADLMDIHYVQSADVLTLTHPNYAPMELRRQGATNWQLWPIGFTPRLAAPSYSAYTPANITHTYVVTAMLYMYYQNQPGKLAWAGESAPSAEVAVNADLLAPGAKNTLSWAVTYPYVSSTYIFVITGFFVYKKIAGQYQYLGCSSSPSFIDDVAYAPTPSRQAPFVGYASPTIPATPVATLGTYAVSATATGTGAVSYSYRVTAVGAVEESLPSVAATCTNNLATAGNYNTVAWCPVAGAIRYNVYKLSNGIYGYIGQAGDGTTFADNNITADIGRTPLIVEDVFGTPGNYPATVTYYQQRRCFAAPNNAPQNVWMTRSGTESNMGYTIPVRDDNRVAFKIAAREASAIRHLLPLSNLVALSASGEWSITSASGGAITPSTIDVKQQSYYGASNVMPIIMGNVALYAAARGGHVREMSYSWQAQSYLSTDVSLLAPHLFDYNTLADMALCKGPIPIVWAVSSTGQLLGLTYVADQQVSAWHRHDTGNGDRFESICTITENGEDMLYCVVNRTVNGATKRYIERLHTRNFPALADAFFVDSGATYYMSGTFARAGTAMTCTIPGHGYTSGNSYAFYFSDTSFGALPNGTNYAVTVVDANTFTLTAPYTVSLAANQAGMAGAINGTNTAYDLTGNAGQAVAALIGVPALYKTNWQGKQLQYATARTNPLLQSQSIDLWNAPSNLTVTQNTTIAPDGTLTADTITVIANGTSFAYQNNISNFSSSTSGTHTFSCYVLKGNHFAAVSSDGTSIGIGAVFDGISGSFVGVTTVGSAIGWSLLSYSCTSISSNWWRVSITFSHPALPAFGNVGIYPDSTKSLIWGGQSIAGDSFVAWGAQIDAGTTATSYIPTSVSPATVTDYILTNPAHVVFAGAPASGNSLTWDGSYYIDTGATAGAVTQLVTGIGGLTWLEGRTVNILADGAVSQQATVINGAITLPQAAAKITVGIPIQADLQTLPVISQQDSAFSQGRTKNLNRVYLRVNRSSGVLVGHDFLELTPYKQRTSEPYGTPPSLVSDEISIVPSNAWGSSGQVCIRQNDPLPLDIVSMTLEVAMGGG